jgi:hypothetical protein
MALALCVALAFLLEGFAAAPHRDHVCEGAGCSICLVNLHIKNLSRQIPCSRFALPLGVLLLSLCIIKQFFYYMPVSSVKLKIKMNT